MNKQIYDSDSPYPKNFLGDYKIIETENFSFLDLVVNFAQYKPKSRTVSILQYLKLEISFDVPDKVKLITSKLSRFDSISNKIIDIENFSLKEESYTITNPFIMNYISNLNFINNSIVCHYLIITPDYLVNSVQALRQSHADLEANVVRVEDIEDQIDGNSLQNKIKSFLFSAYCQWGLQYVVFIGSLDDIPPFIIETTINKNEADGDNIETIQCLSDDPYGRLFPPLFGAISVSRIPTTTVSSYSDTNATINNEIIQKIKDLNKTQIKSICEDYSSYNSLKPISRKWIKDVLLIACMNSKDKDEECFIVNCDDISEEFLNSKIPFNIHKTYGNNDDLGDITSNINKGVNIVFFRGHGTGFFGRYQNLCWTQNAWLFKKSQSESKNYTWYEVKNNLDNGIMLPFVFNICCGAGDIFKTYEVNITPSHSIGVAFTWFSRSIASFACTVSSDRAKNNDFALDIAELIAESKESDTIGILISKAKNQYFFNNILDESSTDCYFTQSYMLFGDPAARLF